MVDEKGALLHQYRNGTAGVLGYLDDYAFFVQGLLDLYNASGKIKYLKEAKRLTGEMINLFFDKADGGFYSRAAASNPLPFRQKESVDAAIPSGNSAAFGNLIRLSLLTGDTGYLEKALDTGKAFGRFIEQYPQGNAMMLGWHELLLKGPVEVIVAGNQDSSDTEKMTDSLRSIYAPEMVVLFKFSGMADSLETAAPFTSGYKAIEDSATAYVCKNYTCNLPTTDVEMMIHQITEVEK